MPPKKKSKAKPFWERAYQGHAYWLGKQKLGKVSAVLSGDSGDQSYLAGQCCHFATLS